jgi:SAM-dependent methyltransferase
MQTTSRLSADQVEQLTTAMWRHTQDGSDGRLAEVAGIRGVMETADTDQARQLQALLEQVDALGPDARRQFTAAVDEVQVRSKLWLIDELIRLRDLDGATLIVLGAWYGILPLLVNWRLERPPARMVCIDISTDACTLGRQVIGALYDNVEYLVADAMDLNYPAWARDPSLVVVNTICEHLSDAAGWWTRIPAGQLAVLQSNNYDLCRDHINCVQSLEEMKAQTPFSRLLFEGVLPLPIFDRYMLIGQR